jgi:uncharacterized membrane protein
MSFIDYLLLCGALAPLWMLAGVYVAGRLYPGYNHRRQAMSELGARDRPTTRIHPFINNYPIGLLFSAFGIGVMLVSRDATLQYIGGIVLLVHGLSHIATGLFPLDADLGAGGRLSSAHKVHGVAGLVMYFALWIACVLWIFIDPPPGAGFRIYSLVSAAASVASLGYMVRSLRSGRDLGLHQRISYGILALWCAILALLLADNFSH